MIKTSVCIELNRTYMVLNEDVLGKERDYRHNMLSENPIKGIMELSERNIDGERRAYIDITEKETLLSFLLYHTLDYDEAVNLFKDIKKVSDELSRYLIENEDLILSPELIFRDAKTGEYFFLCLPSLEENRENVSLKSLLEYLLNKINADDEEFMTYMLLLYDSVAGGSKTIENIYEELKLLKTSEPEMQTEAETVEISETEGVESSIKSSKRKIIWLIGLASGIVLILLSLYSW